MGVNLYCQKRMTLVAGLCLMTICASTTRAAGPVAVNPVQRGKVAVMEQGPSQVGFTVTIGAGYLTGESNELVYWPHVNNHKASELTWKIDNLFMVGVGASLTVSDWFVANFDGWFKATDGSATMDDYDWMVPGGGWTGWSHHDDTEVTDGSIVDVNANVAFYRAQKIAFRGIVGYKRDNFGWAAQGGDFVYSTNSFRDSSGSFADGLVGISYEQTMTSLYGGLGFDANFNGRFELSGRVIYSPFVQGEATDTHHNRNLVTYDDFEDGDLVAFDIAGTFFFAQDFALELMYSYQSYDTMQGDSEWHFRDQGTVVYLNDSSGMDQTSSMLSASLQYSF